MGVGFTAAEFKQFDVLTLGCSSQNQMTRINSRLKLKAFMEKHGKEKCDAMWVKVQAKDAARKNMAKRK